MLLHQLVKINESALVANAVSFELMNDQDKNLRLCEGFVFNYDSDPKKLNSSTVGVLYAVKQSFHSAGAPNIHLMVQDYGKGKSHFGLAIANFFQKPADSPEVRGVLQQIEYATGSNNSILESLKAYKKQGRNLVICLSGDKAGNLKKQFLVALKKSLESEGITQSLGQKICELPLNYLENLKPEERDRAEAYLSSSAEGDVDLNMIVESLRQNNYGVIPRVKEIGRLLLGFSPDFDTDVDVEDILANVINKLCTGENRPFEGVLILFDELYNYLQNWSSNPVGAGGTTLQCITNICERFKGKIALLSFSQRRLKTYLPLNYVEDYNRLSSRLELLHTTYEPAASLELVLDNLLVQEEQSPCWQEFERKWRYYLIDLNTEIYRNRTVDFYKKRNWDGAKFLREVTLGCFPLHPLTVYLLCNLDFTQGRTAIQFVQADVARFIKEAEVEDKDGLNFIYAVSLVEAFKDNFHEADSSNYADYRHARDSIVASADSGEIRILQALFLYYASVSVSKLTKPGGEGHEKLISLLTGMAEREVAVILERLEKERQVIYYNRADNAYRFFTGGVSIKDLRTRIEQEIGGKKAAVYRVQEYCQQNLSLIGASQNITPQKFIDDNKLNATDWPFKCQVYTIADFRKIINGQLPPGEEVGLIAYVIGETGEELASLRSEINQLLTPAADDFKSIKRRLVVAIASKPAGEISRLLLILEGARKKSVQELGAVLTQLQQQLEAEIKSKVKKLFNSPVFDSYLGDRVGMNDRLNPSRVASSILQHLYHCVAPQERNDKIAKKSTKGGEIISYVCKRLLEDDLRPQTFPQQAYRNLIEPVFEKSWRLLKLNADSKYIVQEPTQLNVKAAWDEISRLTSLEGPGEKAIEIGKIWEALAGPPYGHNEYTFTMLFVAWLTYHRSEIMLKGVFGIPQKNQLSIYKKPVRDWGSGTNIFDKPKDFVQKWVLHDSKPQLIRFKPLTCPEIPLSLDHEQARKLIGDIEGYLTNNPDPTKVKDISDKKDKLFRGVRKIDERLGIITRGQNLSGLSIESINIAEVIPACNELREKLSPVKEDGITITFLPLEEKLRLETFQQTIEKIGAIIDHEIDRSGSLTGESECREQETELERMIDSIQHLDYLPFHFTEKLKEGGRVIKRKLIDIGERRKVDESSGEVEKLFRGLSALATQGEYAQTRNEIEAIVLKVPALGEREEYKNIVRDLEAKREVLLQKIADWEAQYSQSMTLRAAVQLNNTIYQDINRFTEAESKGRLTALVHRLDRIISERETEEKDLEYLESIIASASDNLQRILKANNLPDALKIYSDLKALQLNDITGNTAVNDKVRELEAMKSQGYSNVCNRFDRFIGQCQEPINRDSDYDNLVVNIRKTQDLIKSRSEFQSYLTFLEKAHRSLEKQREEFFKQKEDLRKFNSIRQADLTKANSIHICEDEIIRINELKAELHYIDRYASEIDNIIDKYEGEIKDFKNQLQTLEEGLSTVKSAQEINKFKEDYARLEFVFKDSSQYPHYQNLRTVIEALTEDMEIIANLEGFFKQSRSIAQCNLHLTAIDEKRNALHHPERFRQQIGQLETGLREKIEEYTRALDHVENSLTTVTTLREAQEIQRDLNSRAEHYHESGEEGRYKSVSEEANALVSLLYTVSNQKIDTIQACDAERERLLKWREEAGEITARLQNRFNDLLGRLDETRKQIEIKQQDSALRWLAYKEAQAQELEITGAENKLNDAHELMSDIREKQSRHEPFLSLEQRRQLKAIVNICSEIQNQDKESQIITLFQQLPREKRQGLLNKLSQHLLSNSEVF